MSQISQRKKNTFLVLSLLVFSLIGPLIFWLSNRGGQVSSQAREPQQPALPTPATQREHSGEPKLGGLFNSINSKPIQRRISLGSKVLITADNNPDKQAGVQAFASANFAAAVTKFSSSLQMKRNDPEAWIYLNNAAAALQGNAIKIAVSVPIGGNLNVAREILRGVAQAQYEVNNNGGIGGQMVQVEIANDDNDPEIAKQIASEFVKDSSILAVVGHNSSDASIAAAPVYQQGGLVMISPTSVARNLSGSGSYIFRTTPSTRIIADTLARYAVSSARKTKIAICADSKDQATQSFKEEFTSAIFENGGKVTYIVCDFSARNFNPSDIPSQAVSDGADALLLAPSVDKINQATDVARANKGRLALLGNHTMFTFETLQQGQVDANGMVLAVVWHPTTIPGSSFAVNARKFWGGPGSWRTAMAYDATKAAIAGLKSGISREQLQKALSNSGFLVNGATGAVQFLPSGDRQGAAVLVKVQPGQISGTGYDFVPFRPSAS
jgi:branched-chain amino acid transport system substrate-binding protein